MNLKKFHVTFVNDCSQLVKMISEPEEWSVCNISPRHQETERELQSLRVDTCSYNGEYKG